MVRRLAISSAFALACLLSIAQPSRALASLQKSYLVKGRPIENAAEAVIEARQFMFPKLTDAQKCKRLAVVLQSFSETKRGDKPNQFEVAKITLAPYVEINERFDKINVELLRDLYIEATKQLLDRKTADASIIELVKCLNIGFQERDIVARTFLNKPELNTVVKQLDTILHQPLNLLLSGNAKHYGLDMSNYHPSIKSAVKTWLAGESEKSSKLLAAQPMPISGSSDAEDVVMSELSELLQKLFDSLIAVNQNLPEESLLPDRCNAYGRLILAEKGKLHQDDFADKVVAEVEERLKKKEPSKSNFEPNKDTRDDFLFVVANFDPLHTGAAGADLWLDLNECVKSWADEDADAKKFLASSLRAYYMDELRRMYEPQPVPSTSGSSAP